MGKLRSGIFLSAALISAGGGLARDDPEPFEPNAAWEEFETIVRANYAYLDDAPDAAWEAQFAQSREAASRAGSKAELRGILHRTALTFGDPHFIVGPFAPTDYNIVFTSSDLVIGHVGANFKVLDVRAGSSADTAGIRPGWRVLSVDGIAVGEAALIPYGGLLSDPTRRQRAYGATLAANGTRGAPVRNIGFALPDGSRKILSISNPRRFAAEIDALRVLSEKRIGTNADIALIRVNNSLGDPGLIAAFERAIANTANARAVILDLRNTPSGGNTDIARAIIGHFIAALQPYQAHAIPAVERRIGVPRYFVEYAAPRPPHIEAPLIVLHGHWTGSMGEGLVIGLDHAADAITVGSDMGDLLGALWNFDLPLSGARVDLGGEALFHVNGTPRELYVADYPVPSADRSEDGSDPALQVALTLIERMPEVP